MLSLPLVNGYRIPVVGLGTYTVTNENDLETSLNAALEAGYRHIDTAALYKNEHIIGKVLKKWFDSGKLKREDVFVTTKLPPDGVHPDRLESFITKSLEQLQLDYLDLYLIHFPVLVLPSEADPNVRKAQPTDHIAVWKKLEEQVDLGRTRAIGVSNFNRKQVSRILENARIKPASNQIELHIYLQQPEFVKYLQENGIVPVSYASLGNPGLKHGGDQEPPNLLEDPVVKELASKYGKTPGQILLKFLLQKDIVVIPKSVTPKRVKENFDLFDITIDSKDILRLEGLDKGEKGRRYTMRFPNVVDHPEHPFPKIPEN